MSIVNAKLLADNLKRINGLHEAGLSDETIASAARDKTGDASITAEDIGSFRKVGNVSEKKMLVSAKQSKRLTQFAHAAKDTAASAVAEAKEASKASDKADTDA